MKNTTSTNESISFTIDKQHEGIINLSRFIAGAKQAKVSLVFIIEAGINADMVDDLEALGIQECALEFCLQKGSLLTLRMKSLYGLQRVISSEDPDLVTPARKTEFVAEEAITGDVTRKLTVRMQGENAFADIKYCCLGTKDKQFKFDMLQEHAAAQCVSNVVVRSVLEDNAQLNCKGMIHILEGAQRTEAELENKNILLGDNARAVSIPMLEIEANDVICKHGAAVSKLDDEHFFYLQSRGIDSVTSRTMLIESFLH